MASRTRLALFLVVLALATACSGSTGTAVNDPEGTLREALGALAKGPGLTVTVSLETDEASLRAIMGESEDASRQEMVRAITGASLRMSVPMGEAAPKAATIVFDVGGDDAIEFRIIDEDLYARVDGHRLAEAFGQDPAMLDGYGPNLTEVGLPPDALDGRWLRLRGGAALAAKLGGQPTGSPTPSDEDVRARMQRLGEILADASSVEHAGTGADGERLRATVPLRGLYQEIVANAAQLGLPQPLPNPLPPPDQVPNKAVVTDTWVRDGRLTAAELDLRQIPALSDGGSMPPGVERLALRVTFDEFDGKVEAPDGAAEVDAATLFERLGGGAAAGRTAGSTRGGMPTASPASFHTEEANRVMTPDPVLVAFYNLPAYGSARARYCAQISDMPISVRRRHYLDICPVASV